MKYSLVIAAVVLLLVCAISASLLASEKLTSASTNLLMFEGNGSGTFNSKQMSFGFSVRCYGSNCVGALAFPASSTVVNYVTGTVTQLQQDSYMMSLSTPQAALGALPPTALPKIACSLGNTPPISQGDTNTVTMSCSAPAGTGVSQDAAVIAPSITSN